MASTSAPRNSAVQGRIASAASTLYSDNQTLISEIRKATIMMKEIGVDFEKDNESDMVKQLEDGVAKLVEASDECTHLSNAIQSIGNEYQPATETNFSKLFEDKIQRSRANSSSASQSHLWLRQFREAIWKVNHEGEPMPGEEQEDIVLMTSTEGNILNNACPLTGKPITELAEPVRSMDCKHVYEKNAIMQHIRSKGAQGRCPVTGCPKRLRAERVVCDPLLLMEIDEVRSLNEQRARTDVIEDFTQLAVKLIVIILLLLFYIQFSKWREGDRWAMGETYAMNGGDGAYSYTKNSQYQKQASDVVKGMIQDAVIHNLDAESISTTTTNTLVIADLGCSVGPNTFFTVQNMIEAVHNKCSLQGLESKHLEFQVFFNDHSANDFNTLFASLPTEGPQYYAAGVPGSFHGRLFPRGSITLAHSSYAVQWLSKQPQGVANAGRIHYTGASAEVERAYLDQFKRDMGGFMGARAEEMVRGGLMFLIIPGIPDGVSHSGHPSGLLYNFLGESLMELAHEGVVDEGEIEAFNLPIYSPRVGEMREVIEKDGRFSIEKMELTNPKSVVGPIDVGSLIMHLRAALEGIFTAHFGSSVVEKMFTNVSAKAQQISRFWEAVDTASTQLFIVLKRK